MSIERELQGFIGLCQQAFQPDCPGAEYLRSRGYSFDVLQSYGLGYYRGSTGMAISSKQLRGCLWSWGDGVPAIIYPLRTLGGAFLGFQLGALHRGKYIDFFAPGSGKRGLFFYPNTFDWEVFHQGGKVAIVEGCLDACALSQVLRCVLSCLSARVTKGQGRGIRRWAQDVYCVFDNDTAGDKAYGTLEHFWKQGRVRVFRQAPKCKDPQEMMERDPRLFERWVRSWAPPELLR